MKILIIKTSSLGDIIHAFTALSYLRERFPTAQIDWVVEKPFAEIVEAHSYVSQVHTVETKKWRRIFPLRKNLQEIRQTFSNLRQTTYDLIFDLQGNSKSALLTLFAKGIKKVGFGRRTVPEWPNLLVTHVHIDPEAGHNIREDYLALVQGYFGDNTPFTSSTPAFKISQTEAKQVNTFLNASKTILVCPGSVWRNKQLPVETLQKLLGLITGYHYLFIWGNQEEKLVAQQLQQTFPNHSQVVEKLRLPVLQNLMSKVDLVLSMDSLPLHLAGTTSTPTFALFGASLAAKYNPPGEANFALQGSCPYNRSFTKRCPALRKCETGACIRNLEAEKIFVDFKRFTAEISEKFYH